MRQWSRSSVRVFRGVLNYLLDAREELFNVLPVPTKVKEHFLVRAPALRLDHGTGRKLDAEIVVPRPVRRWDSSLKFPSPQNLVRPTEIFQTRLRGLNKSSGGMSNVRLAL